MTTYPLATLAPTIDASGISAPPYSDILLSLQASFKAIYGNDIYIGPDSQDGQWIAIQAKAIHDSNQAAIAVFQSFSPTYAQGAGLSSVVKINGIRRNTSGYSTAVGNVIGVAGTTVINGVVKDTAGNLWNLPASVLIPIGGSISVTATAQQPGAVTALAGTINKINNPQLNWQSFTSTSDASVGAPIELDPALKSRQAVSTALPAQTVFDGILGAVGNVAGVSRFTGVDNDTGATDANGVPAHSLAIIVKGGAVADIANAIALKKTPGGQTYGSTSYSTTDSKGMPVTINYTVLTEVPIYFGVTIKALPGYVSSTGVAIQNAISAYVNGLDIGYDIYADQIISIAGLLGGTSAALGKTFKLTALTLGTAPSPVGTSDIVIAYNAAATCLAANVGITVT